MGEAFEILVFFLAMAGVYAIYKFISKGTSGGKEYYRHKVQLLNQLYFGGNEIAKKLDIPQDDDYSDDEARGFGSVKELKGQNLWSRESYVGSLPGEIEKKNKGCNPEEEVYNDDIDAEIAYWCRKAQEYHQYYGALIREASKPTLLSDDKRFYYYKKNWDAERLEQDTVLIKVD